MLDSLMLKLASRNIIHMSDRKFIEKKYFLKMGKQLNLDNPTTFNEKLQWLKLYNRRPEFTKMVDKYEAKKYVGGILGDEFIIPTIGIYNNFKDIKFNDLPNQFVMKCTHDSESTIICKDKEKIDLKEMERKITKNLKTSYYYKCREWPYKNVKPRIIVEKYMATEEQKELIDYKFFCFNGKPEFIYISEGLSNHKTAKISFANMNYELMKFHRKDYRPFEKLPPKPQNFEEMKKLAEILSKDICFVRVDFYSIENRIYFGELTFYPGGGYIPFEPEEYDDILGKMLELPKEKREEK